jgi:hypothetical protein
MWNWTRVGMDHYKISGLYYKHITIVKENRKWHLYYKHVINFVTSSLALEPSIALLELWITLL